MNANTNTLKTLGKVYVGASFVVTAVTGLAYLKLRYSETKAEAKVNAIWNEIANDATKDLGLNQVPTLVFDANDSSSIMFVRSITHYTSNFSSMFTRKVVGQETDYIIHVNSKAVANAINTLNMATLRDLSSFFVKALLRHECRHMHQFQNGFDVGKIENTIQFNTSMFDGYGADEKEFDANVYAINAAQNKTERLVAKYNKATQDVAEKIFADNTEVRKYIKELNLFKTFA